MFNGAYDRTVNTMGAHFGGGDRSVRHHEHL